MTSSNTIHLPALRHKVPLENLTNHVLCNVTVEYEGKDTFNNLWVTIKPNNEKAKTDLEGLKMKLALEYRDRVDSYVGPVDPLHGVFSNGQLRVRLARAGNFNFYGTASEIEEQENIWSRKPYSKMNMPDIEEEDVRDILNEVDDENSKFVFDSVLSFAGAFVCAEGAMASVVCRAIHKYKQELRHEDDYVVPDTTDLPTDL